MISVEFQLKRFEDKKDANDVVKSNFIIANIIKNFKRMMFINGHLIYDDLEYEGTYTHKEPQILSHRIFLKSEVNYNTMKHDMNFREIMSSLKSSMNENIAQGIKSTLNTYSFGFDLEIRSNGFAISRYHIAFQNLDKDEFNMRVECRAYDKVNYHNVLLPQYLGITGSDF